MKIKELIKTLQQLNENDYTVYCDIEPEVTRMENTSGKGIETVRYIYKITLVGKEKSRKYQRKHDIIEYLGSDKE